MRNKIPVYLLLMTTAFVNQVSAEHSSHILGQVRVQVLSDTLVRLEAKGRHGFEDRETFTVVDRNWPGAESRVEHLEDVHVVITPSCRITVPVTATSLTGVRVEALDGTRLFAGEEVPPAVDFLPAPGQSIDAWVMPDYPRIVPPEWGATPPPPDVDSDAHSGWDVGNSAPDVYVFIPGPGGYAQLRADFLKLTGPIPIPPLYTFGLMDSRYYPYKQAEALEVIDTYRKKQIPLDVFVLDTDWRVGASHGYRVNTKLLPDLSKFLQDARARHIHTMFNDHPEPVSESALDPEELAYRSEGLTSILELGADVWWYDRNWHTSLQEPAPGISKEVWGMRLYHDVTQRYRPERRPLIMSNVDGIRNGRLMHPSHPAAHRFPIWWTGDTHANWDYLKLGLENGVDTGVESLLPYVNEDLGGHIGTPSPELYVRFLQFGVFSPVARLHCTHMLYRFPWRFGEEAERISTDYIRLRYRLLPTLYAAARRAYEDGTPMLRRCDLEWPAHAEAGGSDQYLFGDDLLVAPIYTERVPCEVIPKSMLRTANGKPGLTGEYFGNEKLEGEPVLTRVDKEVDFDWGDGGPSKKLGVDHFSIRWSGTLGPVKESGRYLIETLSDDGVRFWLDGNLLIDEWHRQGSTAHRAEVMLEAGRTYDLRLEYYEERGTADCRLSWSRPAEGPAERTVWIPLGAWRDVWTGERHVGPKTIAAESELWHMPLYAREGGIILSVPQMQYTGERPWSTVVVDAYVPEERGERTRTLYEDDGHSPAYREGQYAKTKLTLKRDAGGVHLDISPLEGDYDGVLKHRTWVVRWHGLGDAQAPGVELNGTPLQDVRALVAGPVARIPFGGAGTHPGGDYPPILEATIPSHATSEAIALTVLGAD